MIQDHTLKILQYNVRKRGPAVQLPLLCDPRVKEFAIIALQEHWRNAHTSQSYSNASDGFYMICPDDPLARVCIYINKNLDLDSWKVITNESDFQTIELKLRTHVTTTEQQGNDNEDIAIGDPKSVRIHNIYNPCPISHSSTQGPTTIPRLREALVTHTEHIVVGDFNLHHPYWGGTRCLDRHLAADLLIETVNEAQLTLLLSAGTVTREQHNQRTTIDLTWASQTLTDRLRRCNVAPKLHQGSDHLPIETIFDLNSIAASEKPPRCSGKNADPQTLCARLKVYLPRARRIDSVEETERYAQEINQAILKAADEATPKRPSHSTYAKAFWNADCTSAVKHARRMRNVWITQGTQEAWKDYSQATDKKGKIIAGAKRAQWRQLIHDAGGSQLIWKLSKWGKQKSQSKTESPQFPPLKCTPTTSGEQDMVTDFEGKADILYQKFFPQSRPADLADLITAQYPPEMSDKGEITLGEVEYAIRKPPADKAPGKSGIPNRILQMGIEEIAPVASHLFNACITQGYHPKCFKEAATIVLRKPNKGDYTEARAYRPIALLDTLGKALEFIIAKRLANLAEENDLLPASQYGARRNRSAETAIEHLVELTHAIWGKDNDRVASILSLDVEGAFDHVNTDRLLHVLRSKGIPKIIIDWVRSFSSDRTTTLRFDNKETATRNITAGIPQGSPISPILFLFYNGPLLEKIERAGLRVTPIGYADDINLLAYGRSTRDTCDTLTKAHKICEDWAQKYGAAFAPQKYELIHMTRRPRKHDMTATVHLTGNVVSPQADIRVLGVQIDSKLRWGPHLANVEEKHAKQMLALSAIGASTWGATFTKARQIYTAVVRPTLTYGAPTWHQHTADGTLKGKERRLEALQNQGLRHISGAFKKTSTETLESETYIQPIGIYINRLQNRATLRARVQGHTQATRIRADKIRNSLRLNTQRKLTPGEQKIRNLDNIIERGTRDLYGAAIYNRSREDTLTLADEERAVDVFHLNQWEKRWESYKQRRAHAGATPAQSTFLDKKILKLRKDMAKAESTMATHIRTERIGLRAYLALRGVPGYTPECSCGFARQTAKHIIKYCPDFSQARSRMWGAGGPQDYRTLVTTAKGLKEASRFMIQTGLLGQFSLAAELLYGAAAPSSHQ